MMRAAHARRRTRRATPATTSPTCARRSPPTRRASHEVRAHGRRTSASTSCRPTCATCRTTPRSPSAASSTPCSDGEYSYEMDTGAVIRVRCRSIASTARRPSTSPARPRSSTRTSMRPSRSTIAAVLYVFRTLVDDDIPLNEGCLDPLRVVIPDGSMLDAGLSRCGSRRQRRDLAGRDRRAVRRARRAGRGHRDDEQRHVRQRPPPVLRDRRLRAPAQARASTGAPVVQTHMTNSRLTDPEVLEWRFPVLVDSFAIRSGSGGAGRWRGGDGAVRRHPVPRADDGLHPFGASPGAAVRTRRRRAGRPRS